MNKIGLALSGGGIKAFSQVPVIAAIMDEGITIDAVSGTSMGSVIAALCAIGLSADEIMQEALELERIIAERKILSRPSVKLLPFSKERIRGGLVDGQDLEDVLIERLDRYGVKHIQDVKIPLAITSVDLLSGKTLMFVSHPHLYNNTHPENTIVVSDIQLSTAVRASCSFPFAISSLPFEGYELVDGGLRQNLPIEPIYDYGCTKSIAVIMHSIDKVELDQLDKLMDLGNRVLDIMRIEADIHHVEQADVVINIPLADVAVFEIGRGEYTIKKGLEVVEEHLEDIRAMKAKPSLKTKFQDMFKSKAK